MSTVKNILVIASDAVSGRAALITAVELAASLRCHLDVLHVRPDPVAALPLVGEAMSGAVVDEMMDMAERETEVRCKNVRSMYDEISRSYGASDDEAFRASEGVRTSWVEEVGVEEQLVATRGCRADFIVLARPTVSNETAALITLNAALMQSGRPIIVAPPGRNVGDETRGLIKRLAVFWNGSIEATRAVAAARPFFELVEEVVVLRAEEEEWLAPVEDLEAYFAFHDVKNVVRKVLPPASRTGEALIEATTEIKADLMVMGAYTRSKLRQLILGSVTGQVLREAQVPILMCH